MRNMAPRYEMLQSRQRKLLYKTLPFSARATCVTVMPAGLDPESRNCVVGFSDGTLRILRRCLDGWKLISCLKPHKAI